MELLCALIAFFALVVSWFALPAVPRATTAHAQARPHPVEADRVATAA
ncbi:MAG TPA: hypothetical protein VFB22_14435 [Candidatus Baltobacteraceae bacterium]|nr:hypothetical protein [Candidatus Baltobacteraceae bacterium]